MSSTKYLRNFALWTLGLIAVFILINVYIDIYGLFLGRDNRKVYSNERTSKYLLSFRYIPENYDGFIIGPSLSDNLDPAAITGHRVYNASVMGANISDLHHLINNIIDRGNMKMAIICLDPYLTKDFGPKAATINQKEYWGALGSTNLLKTYMMYIVRENKLMPSQFTSEISDENGWTNFELEMDNLDPKAAIEKKVELKQHEETHIDERAFNELKEVLDQLRKKNIRIVAYFTPIPRAIYNIGRDDYREFETRMSSLFTGNDILFNLNDEQYSPVTSDYHNYIDHGHLSASGQAFVLKEINSHIQGL
jgi:hypothetical protein